jgi:type IV secretion system protein VirD4
MGWNEKLAAALPRGGFSGEDQVPAARWAHPDELALEWEYSRSSVFLGYGWRNGEWRGVGRQRDDRHLMLVAGSRAGKGVSYVVPNLLLYEGSILALDPKGELARETAAPRARRGQKVVVLDPFGVATGNAATLRGSFNPLLEIDPDPNSKTALDDVALLAEALIVHPEGQGERHWTESASELVKLLMLYALLQPPEQRTFAFVRRFFHAPGEFSEGAPVSGQHLMLAEMAGHTAAFDGVLAGIANAMLGKPEKEFASIVSAATTQLAFLDSPQLAGCLSTSSFKLSQLKTEKTTVYLCLPASRMATHAKWFRMVINLVLVMCEAVQVKPDPPLLLMLDEFPVLGHMRQVEAAAGQIAGFGVRLFTIVQDLSQLRRHYQDGWETFIGNSGTTLFFGMSDATTLRYVSDRLGTIGYDFTRSNKLSLMARMGGGKMIDNQLQLSKLLEPHEVERIFARETERALLFYSGQSPVILRRAVYHQDPAFRELL